jgi:hypothetical protein
LGGVANAIATTFPSARIKKAMLVDISGLIKGGAKSDIQRATRNILKEWLLNPPIGYCIEPVYAISKQVGYRYARQFTQHLLGMNMVYVRDEQVECIPGDCLICLDFEPKTQIAQKEFYQALRKMGMTVKFVIYDFLHILHAKHFPSGEGEQFSRWLEVVQESDGAVCISKAVADELVKWRQGHAMPRKRPFTIDWF